ncbi:MAG TPA: RNA degradosome polyphosphate kinase [Jiangellaceae bacterium]|nr:RNA degradosome polyphosphate kinase [Jiangellaceae bacterium]
MAAETTGPEERYLDRELSWVAFNTRVLELAEDPDEPMLERIRFLAIFSSNLDEFFMVRVAGLKRRIAAGVAVPAASGLLPREVHEGTLARTRDLMTRQADCFHDDLLPAMVKEGIDISRWDDLDDSEHTRLRSYFIERIFPVLTPLAVDPAHPFPYISGLSLNLAVVVRNPRTHTEHFARVKVPPNFPRFLQVAAERFVPLEDVIAAHLSQLFQGMDVLQHHTFRVTRNEDVEVEEDDAENLLTAMERELMRRRFGPAVRLEVEETVDPHVLDLLQRELGVSDNEVLSLPGPLDLTGLHDIANLDRAEHKYRPFLPATHRDLPDVESAAPADMFAAIRRGDILVHHPYDSFSTSVQRFVEQAAADPRVLGIKQTLYRTSGDSPIVDALVDAAEAGKQVLALVEIKARFDERANITWARKLEQAGVHVVYGMVGLKTHCKLCLVVRDEAEVGAGIRRYSHIGTGNYNPKTARTYEDLGVLTADPEVAEDVNHLFNTLSGYSIDSDYARLLVAPHALRSGIVDRIQREVEHHRAGHPARVRLKMNSVTDEAVIDALYEASQAGVPVDIWVRGICCIRAGVPGLSENVRVRSTLGRFLEHSRILSFENAGDPEYWIGSTDLMHRNLDRRVETMVRLGRPEHEAELGALFALAFDPGVASWRLGPDGDWSRVHKSADGQPLADLQQILIERKQRRRATA